MDPLEVGDPIQIGPFRLLGRLGHGGMGRVFLGASPGGRKVAIKVVRPHYANDPEFRRRFGREVAAARRVGDFHVARVVDADPDANPPWLATAYIPGPSVAEAVVRQGPLDEARVRELGAALAAGLMAIHARGLIHRDLKPGNAILADDGPRIVGLGIAKVVDTSALTGSNAVIGALRSMSPEQLKGDEVTPQSDVFALGSVLAYAATGHDPFEAATIPELITGILSGPPSLDPLAGDLRDTISACLRKDPVQRPRPGDLLARFGPQDPSAPERAPSASVPGQRRRIRRPAVLIAPGIAAAICLAAVGLFLTRNSPARSASASSAASASRSAPAAVATSPAGPGRSATAASATASLAGSFADPGSAPIKSVAFAPNGTTVATSDEYGNAYLWNTATGKVTATLSIPNAVYRAFYLAFTPNGSTLVTCVSDDYTDLWSTATRAITASLVDPGNGYPSSMALAPRGGILATSDLDGSAYLWSTVTGEMTGTFTDPGSKGVVSVAFTSKGDTLATGDENGSIYLWNTATGKVTATLTAPGVREPVTSLAFVPGSGTLVGGASNGNIYVWNTATGKISATLTDPNDVAVTSVAFAPDGTTFATSDVDGNIYLWNLTTGKIAATITSPGDGGFSSAAFSPDGATLATGGEDGSLYLWKIAYS